MKPAICFFLALVVACKPPAKNSPPTLSSIEIMLAQSTISAGASENASATAIMSDGSTSDVSNQVTWGSSDPDIANVTCSNGLCALNAGSEGMAVISAIYEGVQGTADVTVSMPTIVSIQAGVGQPSIPKGGTTVATVEATLSDMSGYDVTSQSMWMTSDAGVATISCEGGVCTVTGVTEGTATLTATMNSLNSSVGITVGPPVLASIAVMPPMATLDGGMTLQLTVTETLTDGTTQDATSLAAWSSTDATVASVSTSGLVLAGMAGQAGITATVDIASSTSLITCD